MKYRVFGALVASLSVAALAFVPNPAFARSRSGAGRKGFFRASGFPSAGGPRRSGITGGSAIFWPGVDAFDYGTPSGEPLVDTTPPPSGDVHYTYKYDVPWDWAHRYPPAVTPSDRPYVSSCPEETTTFPGRDGKDRTVNVMRCY